MSRLVYVIGGSGSGRRATALNISKSIKAFSLCTVKNKDNLISEVLSKLNSKKNLVFADSEPKYAFQLKREFDKYNLHHEIFIIYMDISQKCRIKNILSKEQISTLDMNKRIEKEENDLSHFFDKMSVEPDLLIEKLDDTTQTKVLSAIFNWFKKPSGGGKSSGGSGAKRTIIPNGVMNKRTRPR